MLEESELVEADDIYRGESPLYIKGPKSIGHQQELIDEMQSLVHRRKETANKRLKHCQCIKQLHWGDITRYGRYFRAVAVIAAITEPCIENGEPLFNVEYEDTGMDNSYVEVDDDQSWWLDHILFLNSMIASLLAMLLSSNKKKLAYFLLS